MKNALLLSFILLIGFSARAQSDLEVRAYFGVSGSSAAPKVDLVGASSVETKQYMELGVLLSRGIGERFSLGTGVNYAFSDVDYNPNFPPCPFCKYAYVHDPKFRMLTIPVFAEYKLGKVFYAAAGPVLDFQLSEGNNFTDQSGIGYLVGLGAKFQTDQFIFSLFPNYKRHSVIPFDNSPQYKDVLQEIGIQLGVGYQF